MANSLFSKQSKTQSQPEIEAPSEDQIAIAQDDISRIQSQIEEQNRFVQQQQVHLQQLSESMKMAQGNLQQLQNQKAASEAEQLQSQTVIDLRAIANEINDLSWQLGLKLQEFSRVLQTTTGGISLGANRFVIVEQLAIQSQGAGRADNYELLPFVDHTLGSNKFNLAFRVPFSRDQPDRLAQLRQANGTDNTKA